MIDQAIKEKKEETVEQFLQDLINITIKKGKLKQIPRKKFQSYQRRENGKSLILYDDLFEDFGYVFDATRCARGRFKFEYFLFNGMLVDANKFIEWYKDVEPESRRYIEEYEALTFVMKGFCEEFINY